MIKKSYADNYKFNTGDITIKNINMIKNLPSFITNGLTIEEIHIQTIKDIITYYGYLLEKNVLYSFKEFANVIKNNYGLNGKNEWYYDYLVSIE